MNKLLSKPKASLTKSIHFIRENLLDILFPIRCLSCNKYSEWLCEDCLNKIPLKNKQSCPVCKKKITPNGSICFECRQKNFIDGVLVSSFYRQNGEKTFLAKTIHNYKYDFIAELHQPLAQILIRAFLSSNLSLPDFIIPVPLHPRRLRWRGFNQSAKMSEFLSENLSPGFKIETANDLLLRKKYTQPQMSLKNRQQRVANMRNVFEINKHSIHFKKIYGKNILLVDDVITTGSTIFECAKILKQKTNAKKVFGLVLARQ